MTTFVTRTVVRFASLGALLAAITATPAIGQDAADSASQESTKLSLVLPGDPPKSLSGDAFRGLGESWSDWSAETLNLIGDLYEDKSLSAERQAMIIAHLQAKVRTIDTALADRRYASIHGALRSLRSKLAYRVGVLHALVGLLEQDLAVTDTVTAVMRGEALSAATGMNSFLGSVANGEHWVAFLDVPGLEAGLGEGSSTEAAVAAAQAYRAKIASVMDPTDEQTRFMARFQFARLDSALADFLAAASGEADFVMNQVKAFVAASEASDEGMLRVNAARIRSGQRLFTALSPTGERLAGVVQSNFFSENLHLVISEDLLGRIMSSHQTDSGRVADCILGAWVTGCQVSDATVSVDLVPCRDKARFRLTLDGTTRTNTQGRKDPATVYTHGHHFFSGSKTVTFDGVTFNASQTHLHVDANNQTVGLETDYDWIPLIGALARGIARSEVRRKAGRAELIAAQKLARQVIPKFDTEADGRFDQANDDLESKLLSTLREHDLYPASLQASTSNSHLSLSSRTMDEVQLGAAGPPAGQASAAGAVIRIHESLINNSLDRMPFAGRSLTQSEMRAEMESAIGEILGRSFSFDEKDDDGAADEGATDEGPVEEGLEDVPESPGGPNAGDAQDEAEGDEGDDGTRFIFDSVDPIRVRIGEDGFQLVLRMAIQEPGKDLIPQQQIRIPIAFELQDDVLVVEAGRIRTIGGRLTVAAQINRILQKRLPRREVNMSLELPLDDKEPLNLSVTSFTSSDGWLTITAN